MSTDTFFTDYFVWFDPDKKLATSTKIKEAVARYEQRFKQPPSVVYVHPSAADSRASVTLEAAPFVNEHYFYLPRPSK